MGGATRTTHGMRYTPEYAIWNAMKKRCYKPLDSHFKYYGGRGIMVCEQWRVSFSSFLSDVGLRPGPEFSIDRYPNPNGNYEPGNVRWATDREQNRNRGAYNVLLPFDGDMITVGEWAERLGKSELDCKLIYDRLKRGWTPKEAMSIARDATRGMRHIGMKRSAESRANMAAAQRRRYARSAKHLRIE